jgi:thiopeptide-type bacteriocin biosynthesis protein
VPLFDFDPTNESEIENNWEKILEAISISSKSLYQELSMRPYSKLNPYVKKKVLKYILRGRYRATPFGRLAAVGIGDFSDSPKQQLNLEKTSSLHYRGDDCRFQDSQSIEGSFFINPTFEKWGNLQILSYIQGDQRWGIIEIPKAEILELLIQRLKKDKEITYEKFIGWFEDPYDELANQIWEKLLEMGIIHSEHRIISQIRCNSKIDQVFKESLSLPDTILNDINDFQSTAGKLFSQTESFYLESLRGWFEEKYDDRFVPLSLLSMEHEFLTGSFLSKRNFEKEVVKSLVLPENFWNSDQVDLKSFFKPQPINSEIFDLQVVFKLLKNNIIQLENIVCNRPFVYFGRFNRDDSLYREQESIKDQVFQNREVIYAELRLFETELVDSICMSKQLFTFYITPIPDKRPNAIHLTDIEMGLVGNRLVLIHRKLQKTIIPVVANPLNGREISHPIMRLLWELDHQTQFLFFPLELSKSLESTYIPRLVWDNFILQNRKWILRSSNFSSEIDLKMWLKKSGVPSRIAAGYLDRELLLDWNKGLELSILWSEIKKWGKINITEPTWFGRSEFVSEKGRPIYPQFIARTCRPKFEPNFSRFINSIDHCDEDCLYFLVWTNEENILECLTFWIDEVILSAIESENIHWYYLVYPNQGDIQIRIRFLNLTEIQRAMLLNFFMAKSANGFHSFEVRPYYPEIKKYGSSEYRKSEKLFHMESSLLMNPIIDKRSQFIECQSSIKTRLLTELWESILSKHPLMSSIYNYSKARVKSLTHSELKTIKMIWQESICIGPLSEYQRNWIKDYSSIFLDHSSLKEGEESGLRLIKNHIHMQVNRFFLNERKEFEEMIHFHLYKRFGRLIYGN